MPNEIANMLSDYVIELRQLATNVKLKCKVGDDFEHGRHMGIFEAISLVHGMAIAFAIDPDRIGFASFDPNRDAL